MNTNVSVPQTLWDLQVPLYITHASAPNTPFVTAVPRFSYLALLLPRLNAYFGLPCSSFHHEDVLLRNLAVGLLVDLYQPTLPWRLVVGDGTSWDIGDTFLNSAKEVSQLINFASCFRRKCVILHKTARRLCVGELDQKSERLMVLNDRRTLCAMVMPNKSCRYPRKTRRRYGMQSKTVCLSPSSNPLFTRILALEP